MWVSEIMCQQTRVQTVVPYFDRFLARFPTPASLAEATEDGVLGLWSGLGYYRRARLLHRGAKEVVARYGGEEFCVLCEQTDTAGAVLLAERIREELGATVFPTEHGELQVTCSLGVATFPNHAGSAAELFEVTDKALYAAKHGGRNQVVSLPSRAA